MDVQPLGPESLAWRLVGDWRLLAVLGRGLLLQIGHPVVAAGVRDHSQYKAEPYIRLERSLRLILGVVYDGEEAPATAKTLRSMHKSIRGVDSQGHRYNALDPEAFHWVHATIFESVHTMCELLVRPLSADESEQLYQEFRQIGRLYGLREQDMPPDLAAFWPYYEATLNDRIEDNDVVREILEQLHRPPPPPWLPLPRALWPAVRWPLVKLHMLATVGTMPKVVRDRWQLPWTRAHAVALATAAATLRAAMRVVPFSLRYQPRARTAWLRPRAKVARKPKLAVV